MNTEPPEGDDLQRMLVSMKQNVLERATPRPKRRGRRTGIAIGVVGVLLLGVAGGGVALGLIPTAITAEPAPTATSTAEPTPTETSSGAPVVGRPTPTATPAPTSTRPPYSLSDPSTWTISGSEVGPIALGGAVADELDDLDSAYAREVENACPNPNVATFTRTDGPVVTVIETNGVVAAVAIGNDIPSDGVAPTTAEGLGTGSTMAALREAYADLTFVPSDYGATPDSDFPQWTIERNGFHITFVEDASTQRVGLVWISAQAQAPGEFCG
ncbi:hypothetical protein DEJ28_14925 [Curtobacterium sp. MCPF17_002]|uniref:hypothetical protein n=1 Tax=Curtobacterium sp. MCPF17_002 TaxID=2175645 RepID=UPI0011B7D3DF|nr:hypothetical protein [Curtobacterium sp. MCPF17_002]WIB76931.1 hypothetical protein DEJ28_14925 [Curtobacterium sp. MCPF17_002]